MWPIRLLLSGSGTAIQPLSSFVQECISHLSNFLPNQLIDTKAFLQKIEEIKISFCPLPEGTVIVSCDVEKLYPSVNNDMGVPAVANMLQQHPCPLHIPTECIIEALSLCLSRNTCRYTAEDGNEGFFFPCKGTAMGPCHACDYVDVFMGELDKLCVNNSPVPLLSSLISPDERDQKLDWSQFRDDGITFLLKQENVELFAQHLNSLHPPHIKWVISSGVDMNYLDVNIKIIDGFIYTDIYSKSAHNFLPPSSCHPPSTFKGLISSVGTRLRMICSTNAALGYRIDEYAHYFACSGWKFNKAKEAIIKGANYSANDSDNESNAKRAELLQKPRRKKSKKIAWLNTYDPRLPAKGRIINKNIDLLYRNPRNRDLFPIGTLIAADRRRQNLGNILVPTVPKRSVTHGPWLEAGSFPCPGSQLAPNTTGSCDLCKHIEPTKYFISPWDNRRWTIRKHLMCGTKNVVYLIICKHENHDKYAWIIGSSVRMPDRWRKYRSDFKYKNSTTCGLSKHASQHHHPPVIRAQPINCLKVIFLDTVGPNASTDKLIAKEVWWQTNVGTLFFGLNNRQDFNRVAKGT